MLSGSWNSQGDGRDALEFRLQDDLHLHGVDRLWRVLIVRLVLQAEIPDEISWTKLLERTQGTGKRGRSSSLTSHLTRKAPSLKADKKIPKAREK